MREEQIFHQAREQPANQREAFLDAACSGDIDLRQRVVALLKAQENPGSFLQSPAAGVGISPTIEQSSSEKPGAQIGPYKLLEQIGEGGMGTVYMAEQAQPVQRIVALKVIKAGMDSGQVIARFEAERQALALMDHPNIAKVLDAGTTTEGRPYFVMELVKGVPITQYCDENQLPPRARLELFTQVCQAVQHAHQKGIIHRDIKPNNVLVTLYDDKPVPKVIDFGVSKATGGKLTERTMFTGFGQIVGTLEYMSPEQTRLNALDIDTRGDIYSLGVLLYELLTGTTPLEKQSLREAAFDDMLRMIREQEPPTPSTRLSSAAGRASIAANRSMEPGKLCGLVRGELDWIVMKALEKDRNRRYETANGFALDVQRYLADEQVQACPPSAGYRLRKLVRRHKGPVAAVSFVALALLGGVIGTTWGMFRATQAEFVAKQESKEKDIALHLKAAALAEATESAEIARQTVRTMLTNVSQDTLFNEPGLQPLRLKLLQSAVDFYQLLGQQRPNDPLLQAELAAAYFRVAEVNHALDLNGDSLIALSNGLDVAERLRREHPDAREAHRQLGGVAKGLRRVKPGTRATSDPAKGFELLRRTAELMEALALEHPQVVEFQSDLATVYSHLGEVLSDWLHQYPEALIWHEKALRIQEKLVSENSGQTEFRAELARTHFNRAHVLINLPGKLPLAESAYQQSLSMREQLVADSPERAPYRDHLFRTLEFGAEQLVTNNRLEAAEALYRRAVGQGKRLVDAHPRVDGYGRRLAAAETALAKVLIDLKRPQEAEQEYGKAVAELEKLVAVAPLQHNRRTLASTLSDLAGHLAANQQQAEAEKTGRRGLGLLIELTNDFPKSEINWYYLGLAQAQLVQWDQAVASYTKAIELKPNYWESWQHRGVARSHLGQWDQAIADFTQVIALKPDSAGAWHMRGWAHANLGDWNQGVADQTKALELTPKQWWIWYRRAQAHSALKQWDHAIADYSQAIELGATDHNVWLSKAAAHGQLDQPDQAVAEIKRAIARGFQNATQLRKRDDLTTLREREDFQKLLAELEEQDK